MSRCIKILLSILFISIKTQAQDLERIELLKRAICLSSEQIAELKKLITTPTTHSVYAMKKEAEQWPLYNNYPKLKKTVPRVILCTTPTSVQYLPKLSTLLGIEVSIKRDDQLSPSFAGNKRRKAELIFADILAHADYCDTIITFGCVGSNLTVVIAACAQELGLKCIIMLKSEPNSALVRRNLLLMQHYGAELHYYPNEEKRAHAAFELFKQFKIKHGSFPYVVPTGGALPLGVLGYVNAAFELQEQIVKKELKRPDYIYVATGGTFSAGVSCGTVAGLVLGLKAARLNIKVVAVCAQPEDHANYFAALKKMIQEANIVLHKADASFPLVTVTTDDVAIIHDSAGTKYGLFTSSGMEAVRLLKMEGITLDGTYTGKACAVLLRDARAGKLKGKRVLFWNTFCGHDFTHILNQQSYKKLPAGLHTYFEGSTQPLDV